QLFKYTPCQQTFGVNMVALVNGRPKVLTLKDAVRHYVQHRLVVVTRRTEYDLRKAQERAHILEGLTIALDHLDAVITIIRHSDDTDAAKANLMAGVFPAELTAAQLERLGLPVTTDSMFTLSEVQAEAILALRLSRLTGLERQKIEAEYADILMEIERLTTILDSESLRMEIIKQELHEVKEKYNDPRRTQIDIMGGGDIDMEDLIEDERMVVTVSHQGLIKRTPSTEFKRQGRGGIGVKGAGMRDDDFTEHLFVCYNHDYLLFFTDHGQCYWQRVYQIPEGGRTSKGRSIRNLIQIAGEDRLRAVLAVRKEDFRDEDFLNSHYVLMATRNGQVKKTPLEAFSRPRVDGIIAIDILEDDELIEAKLTDGQAHVMLGCSGGRAIRFHEADVRPMGRNTRGVRGMLLADEEVIVGMVVFDPETEHRDVLSIGAKGRGKRTPLGEYRVQSRGGKGILTLNVTSKTGALVALKGVTAQDELMIATQHGTMNRRHVDGPRTAISMQGRNTKGVR
ncbi:MAG: DNA gyrase C-terminal beta-propeller domain-containing protein, partial [Bacteroidota bacterium]